MEPLVPPAKQPRFFLRSDLTEFQATLSQRMVPGVMSYLNGGPLGILAVQVVIGDELD